MSGTAQRVGRVVVCLLALFVVAKTLEGVVRLHTVLPYWDQWAGVEHYGALRNGTYGLEHLFAQHNQHRPAACRLLIFTDFHFFGGRNLFLPVANAALQLAEAVLLAGGAILLLRARGLGTGPQLLCASASLALQFTSAQIETFTQSFGSWAVGHTAATGALAAVAAMRPDDSRWRANVLLAAAVVLASASQLTVLGGIAVWPCLLALGRWRGLSWPRLGVIAGAGTALTIAYFTDFRWPDDGADPLAFVHAPVRVLDFTIVLFGSLAKPLFDVDGAWVLGALGLLASALVLRDVVRHGSLYPPAAAFLVAELASSGLLMVFVAIGRSNEGLQEAGAPRYAIASATFWTCLVALGYHVAPRLPRPRLVERSAGTVAVGLIVLAAVTPWWALPPWYLGMSGLEAPTDSILVGVYDNTALGKIYEIAGVEEMKPAIPVLEEYGLSVFHGRHPWNVIGLPFMGRFTVAPDRCVGVFDGVQRVGSERGAGVVGWAWDRRAGRRAAEVLIVDGDGTIVGMAHTATQRLDVLVARREVTASDSGWWGYSRWSRGPVRAYAIVSPTEACPLENTHALAPPQTAR